MREAGGIRRKARLSRQRCKSEDLARMAANGRENSVPRKRSAGCYAALALCALPPVSQCRSSAANSSDSRNVCGRCVRGVFYFDCVLMCMCIIIIICVRSFNRNKMKYVGKSSGARARALKQSILDNHLSKNVRT